MDKIKELKAKANRLPQSAGVYIMKNAHGEIIYIGKAKALKNRVTQYFGAGNQHTEKVRRMVSNVHDFEYILCDSEFEALILENSLIKQNQPKYNILLKDDKGYHYIKITGEKWKKLTTSMQTDDKKAEYIGPYYSAYVVKETVDEVRRIFKLPDCNRSFDKPTKPCLNYHIGRCDAPCRNKTDIDEYLATLNSAVDFIKHGGTREMIEKLKSQMESAAERLDFEYAARLRDRIAAIEKLGDRQKVVMCTYRTQDVFAAVQVGESFCVSVLMFRNSRLTDKKHFFLEGFSQKNAMYAEFLSGYYSDKTDIPSRILIDELPDNSELLTEWLSDISGRGVTFIVPIRGEQKALLDMCRNNAAENLGAHQDRSGREMSALNELAQLLALSAPPRIIESYDISNTAGSENVAGMVVFRDGRPYKAHYRKFKIKGFTGQDDYRSMAEVLDRRFAEYENGADDAFGTLPDLILLDGAAGQMSAVEPILKKYNVNVPLFGMVKDSKHRTRAIASFGGDISIKSNKSAFNLVTAIQDEVHRYAISYHKKRRTANMLSSELMKIEGVGKTRATALFKHFKTLSAIKCADVQTLAAVKGVGKAAAQSVYDYFHENNG
ncbi:MAG: excinuclease ABC subunit UvrC [Clostridia bacterium]|nr:excinuclease ABC subunit UvrC [Clostridia bacterium]MBQ2315691.1 excinuclease ABC subunit UvrC [Clostridia bacterium]